MMVAFDDMRKISDEFDTLKLKMNSVKLDCLVKRDVFWKAANRFFPQLSNSGKMYSFDPHRVCFYETDMEMSKRMSELGKLIALRGKGDMTGLDAFLEMLKDLL